MKGIRKASLANVGIQGIILAHKTKKSTKERRLVFLTTFILGTFMV